MPKKNQQMTAQLTGSQQLGMMLLWLNLYLDAFHEAIGDLL